MKRGRAFLLLLFALPMPAFAQVVINEVMYNPQGTDTGREWVELYNEGEGDVTMVGSSGKGSWRISDGSNHTLTDPASGTGRGSLIIPAGGYLVIANDPNDFISGEYAGGTYSVVKSSLALNNNGATVTLLDGTGATVDAFPYLPSQGGSDDGTSLQLQADGSWLAALPTPGALNSATAYIAPQSADDSAAASQPSGQPSASTTAQAQSPTDEADSSYVAPPSPSLYADAGTDRTVIVGADVEFDASAYDKTQTLLDAGTVRFMWNFGDGSTAEGNSVLHHFSYPGRYAVVLDIADNKNAAAAQITVTAQPAALSLSLLFDGGVQLQNLAGHDLDLSGWVVREDAGHFAAQFILPEDSKMLSDSSMQISPQTLSFRASSSTMLEYPNGTLALAMGGSSAAVASSSVQVPAAVPVAAKVETGTAPPSQPPVAKAPIVPDDADGPVQSDSTADPDQNDATDTEEAAPAATSSPIILQTAVAASAPVSNYLWWLGIFALAAAAGAAIIAAARFKKREWDIVEDKAE